MRTSRSVRSLGDPLLWINTDAPALVSGVTLPLSLDALTFAPALPGRGQVRAFPHESLGTLYLYRTTAEDKLLRLRALLGKNGGSDSGQLVRLLLGIYPAFRGGAVPTNPELGESSIGACLGCRTELVFEMDTPLDGDFGAATASPFTGELLRDANGAALGAPVALYTPLNPTVVSPYSQDNPRVDPASSGQPGCVYLDVSFTDFVVAAVQELTASVGHFQLELDAEAS